MTTPFKTVLTERDAWRDRALAAEAKVAGLEAAAKSQALRLECAVAMAEVFGKTLDNRRAADAGIPGALAEYRRLLKKVTEVAEAIETMTKGRSDV